MYLDKQTGWLTDVKKIKSPHADARPDQQDISLIVIHNISLPPGEFAGGYVENLFAGTLNPEEHPYFATINHQVSAHIFIDRQGQLTQFVSFYDRAWHAGVSSFDGREKCNDFSIGIELEGTDDLPFNQEQYATLTQLVKVLLSHFPKLSADRITGHADIAPGRKTDPGPYFDWSLFYHLLEAKNA